MLRARVIGLFEVDVLNCAHEQRDVLVDQRVQDVAVECVRIESEPRADTQPRVPRPRLNRLML